MYELLLRTETLFLGLEKPVLWAVGGVALVIGLVFWLGGTRYSAGIIGLFGAVVGSAAGLLVSQWLNLEPWLSILIGAVALAALSILLKNVLILVLAVLVFSAVSGAGYVAVALDRTMPQTRSQAEGETGAEQRQSFQYFSGMDLQARQEYMSEISQEAQTFTDRLKALLANTWEAMGPNGWMMVIAVLAGAVLGILLVWFIAKIVIALAYSLVGSASIFLGAQAALLAAGLPAVSEIGPRRWLLPASFATMTALGWVWQLFHAGRKPQPEPRKEEAEKSA